MSKQENFNQTNASGLSHEDMIQYLRGELSEEKTQQIDAMIDEDPMLLAALESLDISEASAEKDLPQLNSMLSSFEEGIDESLATRQTEKQKETSQQSWQWLKIAAMFLIVAGGVFGFLQSGFLGDDTATFQPHQFSERGAGDKYGELNEAMKLYNRADYAATIDALSGFDPGHTRYELVVFLRANAYAADGKEAEAIKSIEEYLANKDWFLYQDEVNKMKQVLERK